MKRLTIFFFYDYQGIVDEYVEVLLNGMKRNVDKFVVVCNGTLKPEGRRIFRRYTDQIIVRENKGLDVWAYKTAIDHLGWDEIRRYDELIMVNNTICGPLFSFENMFAEMDSIDVDFWGITMHYGGYKKPDTWPDNGYKYVQDHIQSHFIAVRNHMLCSNEFQKYWEEMPPINSYIDSVSLHESVFTRKFSDMGFTHCCFIDCDDVSSYDNYPLMHNLRVVIREKKCPIVKRKRNVFPFSVLMLHDFYHGLRDMIEAIDECTSYDKELIYKNTLRTSFLYFFQRGTAVDFISSEKGNAACKPIDRKKTGIILNINNYEIFKMFKDYLNCALHGFEVIVIADEKDDIGKYFNSDTKIVAKYALESSRQLFTAMEEQAGNYKYFFVLSFDNLKSHSKTNKSYDYNTLLMEFDSFFDSVGQTNYVADAFENNNILGLLVSPLPIADTSLNEFTSYRKQNFKRVMQYSEYIGVLHSEENQYFFPANNIFSCKTVSVKGFSESVEKCFGSLKDIPYDLLLPLYVQSRGYYTARIMTEYNAKIYITLLENILYAGRVGVDYKKAYNEVLSSNSWKITKPLRFISRLIKKTFKKGNNIW